MQLLNPLSVTDTLGREGGLLARITGGMSMTILPFARIKFGIRYFLLSDIIHALILVKLYEGVVRFFGLFYGQGRLNLFPWFIWSFLALAIVHYIWIFHHEREYQNGRLARPIHSMHHGHSWLAWLPLEKLGFNQRRRLRFLEPAIVLLIGWLLRTLHIDYVTGTWLMLTAGALFIQNNRTIQRWINRERDQHDAMIISRKLNEKVQPPSSSQEQAHVVRPHMPRTHAADHEEAQEDIEATVQQVMGDAMTGAAGAVAGNMVMDAVGGLVDDDGSELWE